MYCIKDRMKEIVKGHKLPIIIVNTEVAERNCIIVRFLTRLFARLAGIRGSTSDQRVYIYVEISSQHRKRTFSSLSHPSLIYDF